MSGRVDPRLAERIGPKAARALDEYGGSKGSEYRLQHWFENGRTSAIVAVVYEDDRLASRTTKLVLKTVGTVDEPIEAAEFARHRRAIHEAPAAFAQAHLARLWGDPIRVGDGTWLTLQEIAGEGGGEIEPMAVLLAHSLGRVPAGTPPSRVVDIDPDGFARACGSVVRTVLREWVGHPHMPDAVDVTSFLAKHVDDHLIDPARLLPHVRRHPGRTIRLDGEPGPLPNPFALAAGTYFQRPPLVHVLSGRTHGDLHVENVIMVAHPRVDEGNFFLVDLARYEHDGPLTRDPAHLVLHLLARNLGNVAAEHRERLIDLLLDPEDRRAWDVLPPWMVKTVTAVDSAGREWAAESKLAAEWREQTLLSLVGCALRVIGRKSTRDEDRPWFLRLAARAAAGFLSGVIEPPFPTKPVGEPDPGRRQPEAELREGLARSASLPRTPNIPKVRRTLVDEEVVPALVGEEAGMDISGDHEPEGAAPLKSKPAETGTVIRPKRVGRDLTIGGIHDRRGVITLGIVALALIVAIILIIVVLAPIVQPNDNSQAQSSEEPVAAIARQEPTRCRSGWVVADQGNNPIPYTGTKPAADAVLSSGGTVIVTIQGLTGKSVVLQSMAVEIVRRSPPTTGVYLPLGCQGEVPPRKYRLNLDVAMPKIEPESGTVPFPYNVNDVEPEQFVITPEISKEDIEWRLHLKWTSGASKGELILPDRETSFRTTAATAARTFCFDYKTSTWRPTC